MFLANSRYANTPTEQTTTPDGRTVTSIVLRQLPAQAGDPYGVKQDDRLDLLAQDRLADDTAFWRIADANTALQARDLVADVGDVIVVPTAGS
jgi:hypothetical protein